MNAHCLIMSCRSLIKEKDKKKMNCCYGNKHGVILETPSLEATWVIFGSFFMFLNFY